MIQYDLSFCVDHFNLPIADSPKRQEKYRSAFEIRDLWVVSVDAWAAA